MAYVQACGGDVDEWRRLWRETTAQIAADRPPEAETDQSVVCPYRGLAAYQPEDAEWFFGRERLIAKLRERLATRPVLAVFGDSGCGKSSLLRAGLVPRVRTCGLGSGCDDEQQRDWTASIITPGASPLGELAAHLAARVNVTAPSVLEDLRKDPRNAALLAGQVLATEPGCAGLLLVVDQFEELFTLCRDREERGAFIQALLAVAGREPRRCRVVFGIRADFMAECDRYPALAEAFDDAQVRVGPMLPAEIHEAIVRPADRAGLMVEGPVVAAVVAAVANQPGILPLASYALLETWRRRRGAAVTMDGFEAVGGVDEAIARTAERLYTGLDPSDQRRVHALLLRMITIRGDGTACRRQMALGELDPDDADLARLLERLAEARLVTMARGSVEVAHEALISAWPRLQGWVDEDREGLRIHRRLTVDAADWQATGHDSEALYRGVRLGRMRDWLERNQTGLSATEQAFAQASLRADLDAVRRRRRRRQLKAAIPALVMAMTGTLVYVGWGVLMDIRKNSARDKSVLMVADAGTRLQTDPRAALELAVQAEEISASPEADVVVRQALDAYRLHGRWHLPPGHQLASMAMSDDGCTVVAYQQTNPNVDVYPLCGQSERLDLSVPSGLILAVGRGGTYLSGSGNRSGIKLWSTDRRSPVPLVEAPEITSGRPGTATRTTFSGDGQRVASIAEGDRTIQIWGTGDGSSISSLFDENPIHDIALNDDGGLLAWFDTNCLMVWHVGADPTGTSCRKTAGGQMVRFTPDGTRLAVVTKAELKLCPVAEREPCTSLKWDPTFENEEGPIRAVGFEADGRVVAVRDSGWIGIWQPDRPERPVASWRDARLGAATAIAITTQEGDPVARIATAAGEVSTWSIDGPAASMMLRSEQGTIVGAGFSDDEHVVTAEQDGQIKRWPIGGTARPELLGTQGSQIAAMTMSIDRKSLVTSGTDAVYRVRKVEFGAEPIELACSDNSRKPLSKADSAIGAVFQGVPMTFTGDGHGLYAVCPSTSSRVDEQYAPCACVRYWEDVTKPSKNWRCDGRNRRKLFSVSVDRSDSVVATIDGTNLDLARPVNSAQPMKVANALPSRQVGRGQGPGAVAVNPDGSMVASSTTTDKQIAVWASRPGTAPEKPAFELQIAASVRAIGWSQDGRLLAVGGANGQVMIWDIHHRAEPIATLDVAQSPVATLEFSPDARRITTTHEDGAARTTTCVLCRPIDELVRTARDRLAVR